MVRRQEGWPFLPSRDGGPRTRRAFVRIAALAACIPLFGGWAKGSHVEIVSRYYSIHGASHAELVASVRRNGPKGGRAYGIGYIDFFPRYRTEPGIAGCRIVEAEVGLRVELELPRWDGAEGGPAKVANFGRRFARAIEAHEMEHVRIARSYAGRMRSALLRLKPDASCWSLSSRAEELIGNLKKRHVESQKAFDRRVNKQIKRLL
jgi:predicted secreted Zn-dependent protease